MEIDAELYIDGYIEELKEYGFTVEPEGIQWSLSYSQGDGLSFDFKNMDTQDVLVFLEKTESNLKDDFKEVIDKFGDELDICVQTVTNSFATHYCHSKTRNIDFDYNGDDVGPEVRKLLIDIHEEIIVFYQTWCSEKEDELYKVLETEEVDENEAEREDSEILEPETSQEEEQENLKAIKKRDKDTIIAEYDKQILEIENSKYTEEEKSRLKDRLIFLKNNVLQNPPGTKILVEVEITDDYNDLLSIIYNQKHSQYFERELGCTPLQVFLKDIQIPRTHTLRDCLEVLTEKVNKIYEEGYPI